MRLFDLFDHILIINLPNRADRRQEMIRTLRWAGCDPDAPKVTWYPAIDPRTAAGFSNPGSRGCFLSHIAVLNIARAAGHDRVLILEDDCEFSADFHEQQDRVAQWLTSTPWGIAYLGHRESVPGEPRLVRWGFEAGVLLTHCYAVSGDVLSRLPAYLEAMTLRPARSREGGPMSIDAGFSWFRRQNPDVETVLVSPSLANQRSSRSDLMPRWFDRMPVLRDAAENVRAWRRRHRVEA
jgi:hypothetical protein